MSAIKIFTFLLICVIAIKCDITWGRCKNVERELDSFDLNRYLGQWFELARGKDVPFQKGDCTQANYSMNDDGTVRVNNIGVEEGKEFNIIGKLETTKNPFLFKLIFSDTIFGKLLKGDYQVVDTDYDNYAIVYSCTNLLFGKNESYWILSRTREVSEHSLLVLTTYVEKKFNKTPNDFRITDQSENACKLSGF